MHLFKQVSQEHGVLFHVFIIIITSYSKSHIPVISVGNDVWPHISKSIGQLNPMSNSIDAWRHKSLRNDKYITGSSVQSISRVTFVYNAPNDVIQNHVVIYQQDSYLGYDNVIQCNIIQDRPCLDERSYLSTSILWNSKARDRLRKVSGAHRQCPQINAYLFDVSNRWEP